jgi:hypothetical protein
VTYRGAVFFERGFVPAGGEVAVDVTGKLLDLWAVEMSGGVARGLGQCRVPIALCRCGSPHLAGLLGVPSSLGLRPGVARWG